MLPRISTGSRLCDCDHASAGNRLEPADNSSRKRWRWVVSIVEASDAQPLWTGEEAAPRLFEQVDIQRFELAQNGSEAETQSETNIVSVAAGGLSLAGLSLASGIIGTEPEAAAEEEEPLAPAAPSEYLSNTMFQALTPATARAFTGSAGDSFIGYSSASTTTPDALVDAGKGAGNSATFNMSAGGDNFFVAGNDAASFSGSIAYTGGSGDDSLTFGDKLAYNNGTATLDLGDDTAADIVTFLGTIGDSGGSVTIQNFNFNHDTIDVPATVTATSAEITDASGDLTWTDIGGSHTIVFEGIGTGGSGVQATSAQLLADII